MTKIIGTIPDKAGTILDKAGTIPDKVGTILDKARTIPGKYLHCLEHDQSRV